MATECKIKTSVLRFREFLVKSFLTLVIVACAVAEPNAKLDWPSFRGPNGSGVVEALGLPATLDPSRNLLWKTALPKGISSPVITGGRIFLTSNDGEKLITFALDAERGKILWQRDVTRARVFEPKMRVKNNPASPTPVTDGKNVYVFFDEFGLLAYSIEGQERWQLPLGPFNAPYGMGTSPILVDDKLILMADQDAGSYLLAVDKRTGKQRWKAERSETTHAYSTPIVYRPAKGPVQIVLSGAYQVTSYYAGTGERAWYLPGMAWQAKSTPLISEDTLYVHSWMASPGELGLPSTVPPFPQMIESFDKSKDGRLSTEEIEDKTMKQLWFLIDLNQDKVLDEREWNFHRARADAKNGLYAVRLGGSGDLSKDVLWRYEKSLPNIPSPVLYRDVLYLLREGGILTSLNPSTGEVLKQGRLEGALGPYFASPVAADGKLITVSQNGKVTVLKAGGQWEILSVASLDDECWATPAISGGRVFIRTYSALLCFGTRG